MSAQRQRLSALATLLGMAAALGAFDDHEPPAVVPADPERPGPVHGDADYCCWANYMVSPTTHNADCGGAERAAKGGA